MSICLDGDRMILYNRIENAEVMELLVRHYKALRTLGVAGTLAVGSAFVSASPAAAAGGYSPSSPIPSGTPGGFSQVVQVLSVAPSSQTDSITASVDGLQLQVQIPGNTFSSPVQVVITSPSNTSLDVVLPSIGLPGYVALGGVGITIENADGTPYVGTFANPVLVTIDNPAIGGGAKVVQLNGNGTYSLVSGATVNPGVVTLSFTQDPAFAVLVPSTAHALVPASSVMTPDGNGYWMVAADGGVFTKGDAGFYGSMGGKVLNKPVVGMASTPDGKGYWLVAADGGVFSFGDASFYGSMGATKLNAPVVGMARTLDGAGYWLVAADGGIFSFGDASFYGSMGATKLNAPVVGMTVNPNGNGYWLVAKDGGIFSFGQVAFYGSMGGKYIFKPIVSVASTPDGKGYLLFGADGGVFAFGDAQFLGSLSGTALNAPVVQ